MVDFDNDTTVTTPPGEVVKILVLERREQVIEALEKYYVIGDSADSSHQVQIVRARLLSFWYQVQAMVKRRLEKAKGGVDDPTYDEVEEDILGAKDIDDLLLAFEWLNGFVDNMGLTFIDGRARYDRTRVEDANQKKGL